MSTQFHLTSTGYEAESWYNGNRQKVDNIIEERVSIAAPGSEITQGCSCKGVVAVERKPTLNQLGPMRQITFEVLSLDFYSDKPAQGDPDGCYQTIKIKKILSQFESTSKYPIALPKNHTKKSRETRKPNKDAANSKMAVRINASFCFCRLPKEPPPKKDGIEIIYFGRSKSTDIQKPLPNSISVSRRT